MFFNRQETAELLKWKNRRDRKPLILLGARQVGKTELLRHFGQTHFREVAYFNFEENPSLKQFFFQTRDVSRILQNLSVVHGAPIDPQHTFIIFDEIQECNEALNTLKYFRENAPQYAVASAGSLLGITLGKGSSFPVGKVEFLNVNPLSFTEFLAPTDPQLANWLNQVETFDAVPDLFFDRLLEKFRLYFLSGGMPEPARSLLQDSDRETAQKNLLDILQAYALDFAKHAATRDIARINYIWESVPAQLARENKKFLYQAVRTGARAREYEDALLWLIQARLVHKVPRVSAPRLPVSSYDDLSAFKIYLLDVGLLRTLARLDFSSITQGDNLFAEFKGAFTENYILQSLYRQFDTPRYWNSEGKAEVDFLIQHRNEIIPVEVKSDKNIRSKSLTVYHQQFKPSVRLRFSLRNLTLDDGLLNIPLFMADQTKRLLDIHAETFVSGKRKGK